MLPGPQFYSITYLLLAMQSPATTGQAAIGMTAADSRRLFEHIRHPRIAGDLITAPRSA